jgi:hypothetical protein
MAVRDSWTGTKGHSSSGIRVFYRDPSIEVAERTIESVDAFRKEGLSTDEIIVGLRRVLNALEAERLRLRWVGRLDLIANVLSLPTMSLSPVMRAIGASRQRGTVCSCTASLRG